MTLHFSEEQLRITNLILVHRLPDIADYFDVRVDLHYNFYSCSCFVHNGDCQSALTIYTRGHTTIGNWRCYTRKCHQNYPKNCIGLVWGALENKHNKKFKFLQILKWIEKFINKEISKLTPEDIPEELQNPTPCENVRSNKVISNKIIQQKLKIPSLYFVNRGFSKSTLCYFNVGFCNTPKKPMYKRSVVPIYDEFSNCIGCTGRSIYPHCKKCESYHCSYYKCPETTYRHLYAKWKNSKGLPLSQILYHWDKASKLIEHCNNSIIIVEGPPDVWKVYEAGFKNVVGLLTSSMSDKQQILIEQSRVRNIVTLLDNDEAGNICREEIKARFGSRYNIINPSYSYHDPGETPTLELRDILNGTC